MSCHPATLSYSRNCTSRTRTPLAFPKLMIVQQTEKAVDQAQVESLLREWGSASARAMELHKELRALDGGVLGKDSGEFELPAIAGDP